MDEQLVLHWLCCAPFLGAVAVRRLTERMDCPEQLYNIEETRLRAWGILTERQTGLLMEWKEQKGACRQSLQRLREQGLVFVTPFEDSYPKRLLEIYDYPMGLFVRGNLSGLSAERPAVAIVGARSCSASGEQLAEEFARALAAEQVEIISGLAAGIDGAAHRGALKAGGGTCGVLGCGVNICYPSQHYGLYEQMAERGCLISEFPPDTPPRRENFPRRNRVISGLADAVLVVEAREKSGSLITAELGLEQGREIFAIPGRVTDHLSGGCNQLIQQGAHMAVSPRDLLEYLGIKHRKILKLYEKNINGLAKKEKMVYSCLDFKPKHIDEILSATGLSIGECMSILMELELEGYVYRPANFYYGKKL
ncbi:MAG: DNA-processing protein DprA [Eubacteriales bacterium]|nr:DNA-processing protein DprA [Eubacteriales bacterium]